MNKYLKYILENLWQPTFKSVPEFNGNLIVDGGVSPSDIPRLEELNVNTAVVGTSYIK